MELALRILFIIKYMIEGPRIVGIVVKRNAPD